MLSRVPRPGVFGRVFEGGEVAPSDGSAQGATQPAGDGGGLGQGDSPAGNLPAMAQGGKGNPEARRVNAGSQKPPGRLARGVFFGHPRPRR